MTEDLFGTTHESSARISDDGFYRYFLRRSWGDGKILCFIMLNPSTADADVDDPTIRKCIGFAQQWGFHQVTVVNLYAWRATKPAALPLVADPIGPENDAILYTSASMADQVICAWGSNKFARERAIAVTRELTRLGIKMHCLKESDDTGQPWHPLYVPYNVKLQPYTGRNL